MPGRRSSTLLIILVGIAAYAAERPLQFGSLVDPPKPFEDVQLVVDVAEPTASPATDPTPEPRPELLFQSPQPDLELKGSWNNGPEFATPDQDFTFRIGGRFQFDTVWLKADDAIQFGSTDPTGPIRNGAGFRRLRLNCSGLIDQQFDWRVELEFANLINVEPNVPLAPGDIPDSSIGSTIGFTSVWITVRDLPIGNLRVGNQRDPLGLERLSSGRWLPFMERSFNHDSLYGPANNIFIPGAMLFDAYGADDHGTWAVGVFRNAQSAAGFDNSNEDYIFTGRLTRLLVDECNGERLVHIGGSVSHRIANNDAVRHRARGSLRPGASVRGALLANTGVIPASYEDVVNAELAVIDGPWQLQADYALNFIDASLADNCWLHGGYVQVLYFLTGEHRNYDRQMGTLDSVDVKENFRWRRDRQAGVTTWSAGAWQVGVRFAHLDLTDQSIRGGRLNDMTLGLNHYWNAHAKLQYNYTLTDRNSDRGANDGLIHGFGIRLSHDW